MGKRDEGRRERGELGRREGMEKGVARPNDISDPFFAEAFPGTVWAAFLKPPGTPT
jgi:hypothetical protein